MHLRTHKNKPVKNFGSFDSFKFDGRKRKNNAVNHQKTAYGKGFGVPEVIRTPDLSLRRRSLYPAELRKRMQQLFNFEPSQDSNELPLRRRSLYPAELRKRMQQLFNFEPSQDSNELPLRRRSLYPTELRKHMQQYSVLCRAVIRLHVTLYYTTKIGPVQYFCPIFLNLRPRRCRFFRQRRGRMVIAVIFLL